MNNLAILYENGRGTEQSLSLAKQWFDRSATEGNVVAILNAARAFDEYGSDSNDGERAIHWYIASMTAGNEEAKDDLLNIETRAKHTRNALQNVLKSKGLGEAEIDDLPKERISALREQLLSDKTIRVE